MGPRSLILVVVCGVALACGTNPDVFHIGCRDMDVTLQVGSGLTPEIDWSPDCEVGVVTVLQYAAADTAAEGTALDVAWQIHSPGNDEGPNNLLSPSVRYGRVSGGAPIEGIVWACTVWKAASRARWPPPHSDPEPRASREGITVGGRPLSQQRRLHALDAPQG